MCVCWGRVVGRRGVGDASCGPFQKLFADSLVSILIFIIYFIYIFICFIYFCLRGKERERERETDRQTDRQTDRRGGGDLTPHHQVTGLYVSLNKANSTLPVELISQLYQYCKQKGKKGGGAARWSTGRPDFFCILSYQ